MKKTIVALTLLLSSTMCTMAQTTVNLVKDINPGNSGSGPRSMIEYNGYIYFTADDGIHGLELWRTDGTTAGTTLVKDIRTGSGGSSIFYLTVFNGKLYFSATTDEYGTELWVSDGTSEGTTLFKDINPSGNAQPQHLVVFNNRLFFVANDGTHGQELWSTDGTAAGTELFLDINTGWTGSDIYSTGVFQNHLYFSASTSSAGTELWRTDGTTAGTGLFLDINVGTSSSSPRNFKTIGNKMYFIAGTNTHGHEPWVTDGTSAGTMLLYDVYDATESSNVGEFFEYNGMVYFGGREGANTAAFYVTNGEPSGTTRIFTQNGVTYSPSSFVLYDGKMFFRWGTQNLGTQLFVSDGTASGTTPHTQPTITSMMNSATTLLVFNNKLFFGAKYDDAIGQELYVLSSPDVRLLGDVVSGPVCPHSEVTVTAQNANKYAFYLNDDLVQAMSASSQWVANNLNNNDKVTVHGFDSSDQLVGKDSVIVQVVPINAQVTLNGTMIEAVEQAGATYLWSACGSSVLDGTFTSYNLMAPATGEYKVAITLSGCTVESDCMFVQVGENPGVGIEAVEANVFTVYPNPTDGKFMIDFAGDVISGTINVTDLTGKLIKTVDFNDSQLVSVELNGNSGLYLLNIHTSNGNTIKTISLK